jgi:hypothetical protein|tara:strand:+ start:3832 stop:4326 length:495 start_codon:yes stop_codon:yes gene_type:complete
MTLTATTGTFTHPQSFGQYPNARIEYIGERHIMGDNKAFTFIFGLMTENGIIAQEIGWRFKGVTPSGNTIADHGIIISGGTSGSKQKMDFIEFTLAGGDYDYSGHTIGGYPKLSYEDLTTYFELGGKMDKVGLPVGEHQKRFVKWLMLNTVEVGGQKLKEQFSW